MTGLAAANDTWGPLLAELPEVALRPEDRVFTSTQLVRRPLEEVFAFFSDPANLEAITPPWLSFRIVHRSTEETRTGTEFTYRLRLRGVPVSWKSRIEEWRPGRCFVDVQLKGPYARWHHTHAFASTDEGTLVHDRVVYRLPFGRLGRWLAGRLVEADVRRIFRHRHDRVREMLEGRERSAGPAEADPALEAAER